MDFTWLGTQICICYCSPRYIKKRGRGSENQSVSGVATICLMQRATSPSHRVDQAVDCGMWNFVPLLFKWLCKVAGYWRQRYTLIQSIPNMLNGWHQLWWTFQSAYQLRKLETSLALCCETKLHILEWPFIVPRTRYICVMIMLFNQLLDMPHLSGGWIILAKEKCSWTGM